MNVDNEPGIQTRVTSQGVARFRGTVSEHGGKVVGPWRSSLGEAKGDRTRMLAAKLDGPLRPADAQTVEAASDRFLAGIERGTILSRRNKPYAASTLRGYEQAFRDWINPELGHIDVTKLRRSQVQRWIDWLGITRANGSVRNTWAALAALYAWLLPRHDNMVNPTDGVKLPSPAEPRERYASPEEMRELLSVLSFDLALPFALAFYAGLRRGEVQALDWCMVGDEWIDVVRSLDPQKGFVPPKSGKPRSVPISDALRPFLTERGSGLVLPSRRRSRWGTQALGRPYTLKCEKLWLPAGLEPIGLHEARHSYVTSLVRAGYDIKLVQEWAGHADPLTTLRVYTKMRGRETGLVDKLNDYLEV